MTAPISAGGHRAIGVKPEPQKGREETRRRILEASLELFGRDGFENTTVRAIAQRCGLTDPALYYYFRSKREILDALWDTPQARRLRQVNVSSRLTVQGLMDLVDEMITASAEMDAIIRLMYREALGGDQAAAAFRRRTMNYWRRDVRAHFATVLSPAEADLNTDLLTMMVMGITFRAQVEHKGCYPEVARTEEFRERVRATLRLTLPFCRQRKRS